MGLTFYFFKNNYTEMELERICTFISENGGNAVIVENGDVDNVESGFIDIIKNH